MKEMGKTGKVGRVVFMFKLGKWICLRTYLKVWRYSRKWLLADDNIDAYPPAGHSMTHMCEFLFCEK